MRLCVFFFLFAVMSVAEERTAMTAEDVARLGAVGEIAVSADGKAIAYLKYVPALPFKEKSESTRTELWVWDEEYGNRPFVTGSVHISNLQWRPGTKPLEMSYLAKRFDDKHSSLYCIPLNGGESKKILSSETGIKDYAWHPSGQKVAYLAKPKSDSSIENMKSQGFNQEIYEESVLPVQLFVKEFGRDGKASQIALEGTASELNWSPDGAHLSVAVAPKNLIDHHYMYRRLHLIDASNHKIIWKLEAFGKLGKTFWAPDSAHIAFISGIDQHDPSAGRVFVVNVASSQVIKGFVSYPGQVEDLAWKDANTLYFLGSIGTESEVAEWSFNSKAISNRQTLKGLASSNFDLAGDGSLLAFTADSPSHPKELFTWNRKTDPVRVTKINPWLDSIAFGKQDVITYKARDGVEVQAMLIYPVNYKEGVRYPLIVTVHGGPEAHYSNGFLTRYSSPGQVAAGQGYFVLYPNYRGSTGRGLAYSKMSQGDAAGKEFDDLVDGVDALIEKGLVDGESVGITGGSYGGYATAWCSTYYSDRFAAGVMFVGISNKISKAGTTDIPDEETLVHALSRPWEKWDFFLERSPVFHVEKAKTPLLIMHGKEDPRVHPGQSMELYRHVKTLGQTPVRLVFYPGEGHGNRKSAARYDYNLRMMRWFNHFLKEKNVEKPGLDLVYPLGETKTP